MFSPGDMVMHPSEGVCAVENKRVIEFKGMQPREYYVLRPSTQKNSSMVYMPVARGNDVLRRLLSRRDIVELIRKSREYDDLWVEDSRMRKEAFSRVMTDGDYARVIRMIALLHQARDRRLAEGKKPCASDEALLAQAERLVHQEFSYVLRMSLEETVEFVRSELESA